MYVPGVEASSAEERIGQFGGLIPTLYTMDSPPAQRRITLAPNRYAFEVGSMPHLQEISLMAGYVVFLRVLLSIQIFFNDPCL